MATVVVVGLGPGPAAAVPAGVAAAAERTAVRLVRTSRHPSAGAVAPTGSFDDVYESAGSLPEVYGRIVEDLVAAALEHGEVLYAVPGSPLVAERTVELLVADERVDTEVLVAPSFLDLVWARLGIDPLAAGVRLVDGQRFAVEAAGDRGPLLVAQCDSTSVLSEVKLAVDAGPGPGPGPVTVLQRLGLADEAVTEVAWDDLDRLVAPDHLTSVWIPELAAPVGGELVRFDELVHTLRERCPWDREQTHQSLTRHLLEETHEVLEAIAALDGDDGWDHLEEELGDLLFQVVFHATLAGEAGRFTLADVARGIHDKLVRRHPHVFADAAAETPDAVMANWEQIKRAEKGRDSLMDGIPSELPALLYAHKVQRKAASVGFDWDDPAGPLAKVDEELTELVAAGADDHEHEVGDVLFSVVNVARHLQVDPETALRGAAARFRDRFRLVEEAAAASGIDLAGADLATLDDLWAAAKARLA